MPMPQPMEAIPNPDGSFTYRITKIKKVLLETDVKAYQIAAAAGIHPTTLSNYTLGRKDISQDHLISLCKVLDCSRKTSLDGMRLC